MITYNHIELAHSRISKDIHFTPILTSESINNDTESNLFFKCENFQKTGSFKIRGATNAILQLSKKQITKGIVTTSSGNHGAAVSYSARKLETTASIVMPNNTPKNKIQNVERYGGKIIFCEPNINSREDTLKHLVEKTGSSIIHPYNDEKIIAGQGTAAKELIEEVPDLDAIICPVSGGGLLSGTLIAAKNLNPNIKVYGAEPKNADDTYRSILNNKIMSNETTNTIADGLRAQVGSITFPIIQENVDSILETVGQDKIEFIDGIKDIKTKEKLKRETKNAFEIDIFGAPTFVVNNKIFWGQDRLNFAIDEYNS